MSKQAINTFKRHFNSKFLFTESLGLNHFTSTYPIPTSYLEYKHITLNISIHESVCGKFTEENEEKIIVRQVKFYYV